jgi:hypothetical protein
MNAEWGTLRYLDIVRGKKAWGAQERRGFAGAGAPE